LIVVFVVISIGSCTRLVAASRIDLDRDWMFRTDPDSIGQRSDWQSHPPTDTLSINLPHTWNLGRQDGYLGKAWYCKTFAMPLQSPDLHVKLHCQNDVIARTSGPRFAAWLCILRGFTFEFGCVRFLYADLRKH
jgi:hypothetical protein